MKKLLASILAVMMIAVCCPALVAEAATTPNEITEGQVTQRINTLVSLIADKYFTVNQSRCTTGMTKPEGETYYLHTQKCNNCNNALVIKEKWFKEMFGGGVANNDVNLFPKTATTPNSYSCAGFANFAMWYIFKTNNSDKVSAFNLKSGIKITEANLTAYAKPGDSFRTSNGHSFIYVSHNASSITVLECNGETSSTACVVRKKSISYSSDRISRWGNVSIYRATNYAMPQYGDLYKSLDEDISNADYPGKWIRATASSSGKLIGSIPYGEYAVVSRYSADGNWAYVTYKGITGWTKIAPNLFQYQGPSNSSGDGTEIIIPDGYLYKSLDNDTSNASYPGKWIRSTDSTSGTLVGSIPYGEYAVVTKYNSSKTWGYVNYKGVEGWTMIYEKTFPYQGTYTCPVVTFNANGGSVSISSKKVYINTPYGTLPAPTRSGYIFDGWYTSINDGTKITNLTNVTLTASQTLYARWTAEECTHKSVNIKYVEEHPHIIYEECKACGEITYTGELEKVSSCAICNPTKKQVVLTYNANGGVEPPSPQTVTEGESVIISNENLSRVGYKFLGWSTKQYPTENDIILVGGNSLKVTSNLVLYAVWEKIDGNVKIILTIDSKEATVSGKTVYNDVAPIIRNDRTMLPARFVAENLGAAVAWDDASRKVTITGGDGTKIEIYIDSSIAYVNGIAKTPDSPAFIKDSRTYTPVRFICESLGADIEWDEVNRRVTIIKQ